MYFLCPRVIPMIESVHGILPLPSGVAEDWICRRAVDEVFLLALVPSPSEDVVRLLILLPMPSGAPDDCIRPRTADDMFLLPSVPSMLKAVQRQVNHHQRENMFRLKGEEQLWIPKGTGNKEQENYLLTNALPVTYSKQQKYMQINVRLRLDGIWHWINIFCHK